MREHAIPYIAARGLAVPGPAGDYALCATIHDGIDAVADEWEALADRTGASPFLRAGWIRLWQTHFARSPVRVVSVRSATQGLCAVLPFMRGLGVLRSPTNVHSPEFGLLVEDPGAAPVLFARLFGEAHHRISLALLQENGRDALECLAEARRRGERTLVRSQQRSPYVDLRGVDWDSLEGALPSKLRSDLRRRERRLGDAGKVTYEVSDGTRDLDRLLAEGLAVEPSGWKAQRGTAISSRRDTARFYADVAAWAARRGVLRLAFLRLDGRAVAFQFGLEERGTYYFLKGGYDVNLRQFAPGKLLARHMLARSVRGGLERFEFLGASEPWKAEWTRTCRERVVVSAFATGPVGQASWVVHRFGRPLAKGLAARVRRWQVGRRGEHSQPTSVPDVS